MFQDYLLYATDVEVRYAFRMLHLSHLVQQAQSNHKLNNGRALWLSDALLGNTLLASILEENERINLRIQCESDFTIGAETTKQAEIRGYMECVNEAERVQRLDEGKQIAPDTPLLVRSLRWQSATNKLFEGRSQTLTNSVELALNEHLKQSYQMNSFMRLESWIDASDGKLRAFGAIFMELPNTAPDVSENLWSHVFTLPSLKALYQKSDDPDTLASALIPDKVRPIQSINPQWKCSCSQASVEDMLLRIPRSELSEMTKEGKPAEIRCHYCSKNYVVTVDRMKELLGSPQVSDENASGQVKH